MHFLIIEDEKILREKYFSYLAPLFDQTDVAEGFYEAKGRLEAEEYDVALVDYNLPDGNGLELVKQFSPSVSPTKDPPVLIMITAYSKEKLAIESLNLGVFRYIEKPITKDDLLLVIKDAIKEAKKRAEYKTLSQNFTVREKCKNSLINEFFVSSREIEVLEKILIYGKNKPVADVLQISAGTVRNHLSSLFQKLHVSNKEELREKIKLLNS